jgi:hypothetical protein
MIHATDPPDGSGFGSRRATGAAGGLPGRSESAFNPGRGPATGGGGTTPTLSEAGEGGASPLGGAWRHWWAHLPQRSVRPPPKSDSSSSKRALQTGQDMIIQ